MGREVIKQPNGLFAIWSSIVDSFIFCNLTLEEYIQIRLKEEERDIRETLTHIFNELDKGNNPYKGYDQQTFEECIELMNELGTMPEDLDIKELL